MTDDENLERNQFPSLNYFHVLSDMRPTLQFQVNCLDFPIIIKSFKFKLSLNTSLLKFQDFLQFSLYITFKGKIDDHIFSLHVILLVLLEIK